MAKVPTRKNALVLAENGHTRGVWLNTGHKHANNTIRDYFIAHDPFTRNGYVITSVDEDEGTFRYA